LIKEAIMNAIMLSAVMLMALSGFAVPAFGGLLESPIERANREASHRMWSEARDQLREQISEFNQQITEARAQFWATYPDKPGADQAQQRFGDLLRQKDAYYLAVALGGRLVNAGVEEPLDGGIRRSASPEFDDLVKAASEGFRGGDMMQMGRQFFTAIDCCPTLYKTYVVERDWWEFDHVQRIPVGCDKPETYGACLYRRWGKVTGDEAGAMYDAMVELLGKQLVYDAAKKVMASPKTDSGQLVVTVPAPWKIGPGGSKVTDDDVPMPDGVIGVYSNPLLALQILSTKDDDRRYLLYLLKGQWVQQNRSLAPTQWAFAAMVYDRLKIAFGEKELLEAARAVRTAKKRMTDGWVMDPKAIGSTRMTPFSALEDTLARKNPRGYVRNALMFNYGALPLKTPAEVDAAYKKFVSENGEEKVLNAAEQMAAARPNLHYFGELETLRKVLDGSLTFDKSPAPETLVDFPDYVAWKKFKPGAKVTYTTRLWRLQRNRQGVESFVPQVQHHHSYQLQSINTEQAKLWHTITIYNAYGAPNPSTDRELFYPAKYAPRPNPKPVSGLARQSTHGSPVPTSNFGYGSVQTSAPVESGEETVEINGKRIATRWKSASYDYGDDASYQGCRLIVKEWTSDEVPTGLVRKTEDRTCPISTPFGAAGRFVVETYLDSFDGFTPAVPDPSKPVTTGYVPPPAVSKSGAPASEATPATETKPAPSNVPPKTLPAPPRTPQPPPAYQPALPPAYTAQAAFAQRFSAVGARAGKAKGQLAQLERTGQGVQLPADVRAARDRLDAQLQAAILAYQKQNTAEAEKDLQSVEDSLAVMEKYLEQ
jgi:hypothetical protein